MFKELTCDNLRLRKYTLDDAEMFHRELGIDPEMFNYTGWNPFATLEGSKETIEMYIKGYEKFDNAYAWVIEDNGKAVGSIGAYDYDPDDDSIEIGYSIFKTEWGKGYASKAAKLVVDFLQEDPDIVTIRAWAAKDNLASRRVLEKAGLKYVMTIKNDIHVDENTTLDKVIYALTNEENRRYNKMWGISLFVMSVIQIISSLARIFEWNVSRLTVWIWIVLELIALPVLIYSSVKLRKASKGNASAKEKKRPIE